MKRYLHTTSSQTRNGAFPFSRAFCLIWCAWHFDASSHISFRYLNKYVTTRHLYRETYFSLLDQSEQKWHVNSSSFVLFNYNLVRTRMIVARLRQHLKNWFLFSCSANTSKTVIGKHKDPLFNASTIQIH